MSREKSQLVVSKSKIYQDVNSKKGSDWYETKNFVPQWVPPDNYYIIKKVGRGKYSTVFKGLYQRKSKVAIKCLVPLDPRRYLLEIKILLNLRGKTNIVLLKDLLKDPATGIYSLVFEWVEFSNYREIYPKMTIEDIRYFMAELLKALNAAHANGIMHRDVKPQNVMIDLKKRKLRLIDWGLAAFYFPGEQYSNHVATRIFKAPELFLKYPYYDYSVDIWCAGMTYAVMLFRRIPLEGAEDDDKQLLKLADLIGGREILEYARSLRLDLPKTTVEALSAKRGHGWSKFIEASDLNIPETAMDLLKKLLTVDHRNRPTANEALQHPFFAPLQRKN